MRYIYAYFLGRKILCVQIQQQSRKLAKLSANLSTDSVDLLNLAKSAVSEE